MSKRKSRTFKSLRLSKKHDLAGLTVGVYVAGGGSAIPAQRPYDDMATLTAGYMYHTIRKAGGTPLLTRADDRPFRYQGKGTEADRNRLFEDYGCRLFVSFKYEKCTGQSAIAITTPENDSASKVLAENISSFLIGHYLASEATALQPDTKPVTCEITFQYDPDKNINQKDRLTARKNAIAICRGIKRFYSKYSESVKDVNQEAKAKNTPFTRRGGQSKKIRDLARVICPEGKLTTDRVEWFCNIFPRLAITNPSLTLLEPTVTVAEEQVTIGGITNTPLVKDGLIIALKSLGIEDIQDKVRVLPEEGKLQGKLYGACKQSMAITFTAPSEYAGKQTQLLFGEPVFLLDHDQHYYLIHGSDGYWGWVRDDAIHTMSEQEFLAYNNHLKAVVNANLEFEEFRVPRGATVAVKQEGKSKLELVCPDGKCCEISSSKVKMKSPADKLAAQQRVLAGLDLLYIPYLFGGRSPIGLDCSGLVMGATARSCIPQSTARDAWQMAFAGTVTATRWSRKGMKAGDIIYFITSAGRIYHTGIALNSTHIVDCSPPAVQIGSIIPGDPLYDERMDEDFFMAKQP